MNLINLIKFKNEIDTTNWKLFEIGELFDVIRGKRIVRNRDYSSEQTETNIYPVITPTLKNNGIDGFYNKYNCSGNCIVVGGDVSGLQGFYQPNECWVVDTSRIIKYKFNQKISKNSWLFILSIISKLSYLFDFQKKANPYNIKALKIKLPVDANGEPDWEYMDNYIAQKEKEIMENIPKLIEQINTKKQIDTTNWKYFKISELFNFPKVKKYSKIDKSIGKTPFITCQSSNNGIAYLCGLNSEIQNAITISTNGNNFDCFYHDYKFIPSSDVELITHDKLNKNIALFICTILDKESKKYTYGKKAKNGIVGRTIIKLPVDANGEPDWEYMENYVKNKWKSILDNLK